VDLTDPPRVGTVRPASRHEARHQTGKP
jgi:hypothetical protein